MKNRDFFKLYFSKAIYKIILSLFCSIFYVCSMLLIPYFSGLAIDQVSNEVSIDGLLINLYIIIGLIIIAVVSDYLYEINIYNISETIIKSLKDDLYKKINNLSINYLDTHSHGDLLSRTVNDIDNLNNAIISIFKQLFQGVVTIVITLFIMFYMNYLLAFVVLIFTPFGMLISYFVASKSHKYYKKQGELNGDLSSLSMENIANLDVIKSFNCEKVFENNFRTVNDNLAVVGQKAQLISSFTNPSSRLINNFIYAIVGILGAIFVVSGKGLIGVSLSIGGISAFLQYATQFAKPLNEISSCMSEIQLGKVSLSRIVEILSKKEDINDGHLIVKKEISDIFFDHVFFSYDAKKRIIEDFTLEVKKGQKIAIVGPTGCGKTTIVNLLLRFYDNQEGRILINKIDSREIEKSNLRSNFKMVLQDTWIFNGTVLENIKYGNSDASMDMVVEAAKESNSFDFISRLPEGFNTLISDKSGLSIGEKQLINITRVMLCKPKIVILDEMTSNIDTRTELKIINAFMKLMEKRTSIIIAHRLSTIVNSDKIVVMKNGSIDDIGSHKELMAKKGFYYSLFISQYEK